MTQELVLVGLLTGLIGLGWVMMFAVAEGKHGAAPTHESEPSGNASEVQQRDSALKHQTTAA
jgi:hypothetical protein